MVLQGSQLPSRDKNGEKNLGEVPLFAIHVYLLQEWAVSYAKIQIYMLDGMKMIEETVIRKQIFAMPTIPMRQGVARDQAPHWGKRPKRG